MIEVFNLARTVKYGCYANFKLGKIALNDMRDRGELTAPSVLVCQYKNEQEVGSFVAVYRNNAWRKLSNSGESAMPVFSMSQILKQTKMKKNLIMRHFATKSRADKALLALGEKRPNSRSVPARHKILMRHSYSALKALIV